MNYRRPYLELDDRHLLDECDVHTYKASGPGGQHRNKVSSAVRLAHRPTGVSAHGDDSRSQHTNKRLAIRRLKMNIACRVRIDIDMQDDYLPDVVRRCIFHPRGRGPAVPQRLKIGKKDGRFWLVAAFLLDVLVAADGRLSDAAGRIGITTANLSALLKSDRHLLAAVQQIRQRASLRLLS